MKPALIIFIAMLIVGIILYVLDRLQHPRGTEDAEDRPTVPPQGCTDDSCGLHSVCPSETILNCAVSDAPIEYYDDEELDAFKGRAADAYSDDEMEQFRDVLYTLQPGDLIGWFQSLKRRGIALPEPVNEEYIFLGGF